MMSWCYSDSDSDSDSDDRGFVGAPPRPDQLLIPLGQRVSHPKRKELVSKMKCEIRREERRRKKLPPVVVAAADDIKMWWCCSDRDDPRGDHLLIPLGRSVSHTKRKDLVSKMKCEIHREERRRKERRLVAADDILHTPAVPCTSTSSEDHAAAAKPTVSTDDLFLEACWMREEVETEEALSLCMKREDQWESLRRMEVEAAAASALTNSELNQFISSGGIQEHGSNFNKLILQLQIYDAQSGKMALNVLRSHRLQQPINCGDTEASVEEHYQECHELPH